MARSAAQAFDPITIRVRRALYEATGRILEDRFGDHSRQAGKDTFKRLQGTYGAALRALATKEPDLTPDDLMAAIVAPAEFPDDPEAQTRAAQIMSGARDRSRKARYGPIGDFADAPPPDLSERIAEMRQTVADGAEALANRQPVEPEKISDPQLAAEVDYLRRCITKGRAMRTSPLS